MSDPDAPTPDPAAPRGKRRRPPNASPAKASPPPAGDASPPAAPRRVRVPTARRLRPLAWRRMGRLALAAARGAEVGGDAKGRTLAMAAAMACFANADREESRQAREARKGAAAPAKKG